MPIQAPTWSGVGPDVKERFIEFIQRDAKQALRAQVTKLDDAIAHHRSVVRDYTDSLRESKEKLASSKQKKAEVEALINAVDIEGFALEQFVKICELPSFLGFRVDEMGKPVVALRLIVEVEGSLYDLGDFELCLGAYPDGIERYRRIRGAEGQPGLKVFFETRYRNGVHYAGHFNDNFLQPANLHYEMVVNHIHNGEYYDAVVAYTRCIVEPYVAIGIDRYFYPIDHDAPEPDTVWRGIHDDIESSLIRSLKAQRLSDLTAQLERHQDRVVIFSARLKDYSQVIKDRNAAIAHDQAKIRELKQLIDAPSAVSAQEAESVFRYILHLPGVMGVRIGDYGVPVVHVRTTYLHEGRHDNRYRFDMGDFEVHLKTPDRKWESRDVLYITQTRKTGYRHLYFHERDAHINGTKFGWFCFGVRTDAVRELFSQSKYDALLHLVINTMNEVNEGDKHLEVLRENYPEVDIGDVWKHPRRRTRARRVSRAEHERRLAAGIGRVALLGALD